MKKFLVNIVKVNKEKKDRWDKSTLDECLNEGIINILNLR